ncbi:MAG: hypothetical protein RSD88_02875 [Anaerovoracaceae bacterium]
MNTQIYNVNNEDCNELAQELFLQISGINKEGRKFERMNKEAFIMRKKIEEHIKMRAAYSYIQDVKLEGRTAIIAGEAFYCNAFEKIRPDTVKGAYIYALSAGDFSLPEDPIMNQLYADIWGTAFTDAVRLLLKKDLEKRSKLSDSFGPGFYGMDVAEMVKMTNLINFDQLEMELRSSSIILPLKSCTGLYFHVTDQYEYMNQACEACRGSASSCKLCQQNQGGKN